MLRDERSHHDPGIQRTSVLRSLVIMNEFRPERGIYTVHT